jgi:hypothetical protein
VFDAITNKAASVESGLQTSRPYRRSSVVLAVRGESGVPSLAGRTAGIGSVCWSARSPR